MTQSDLLSRLSLLPPSQFEEVLFLAEISIADLSSASAPQKTRAIEAIRYLEQQSRLEQLDQIVNKVKRRPS